MRDLTRLVGYLKPYLLQMILGTIFLALSGAMMSVVVATAKPLVNEVLLGGVAGAPKPASTSSEKIDELKERLQLDRAMDWLTERAFVRIPLLLLVLFLLRGVLLYFGQFLTIKAGACLIRDLRRELYEAVIRQSLGFFHHNPTGLVMSRIFNDVQRIQMVVSKMILADVVRVAFMAPCMLVVVLIHDWRMTFFAVVVLPLFAYPIVRLGSRLRKASQRSQEITADASNLLNESVVGIKIVQSFAMEKVGVAKFRAALAKILRADLQAGRAAALAGPIMEWVGAAAGAALFYIAGAAINKGRLDPGDFIVVLAGLAFLFTSIRRLTRVNNDIQQALAAAVRVFEMLDWPREIADPPEAKELPPFRRSIRFDEVEFSYPGGEPVLRGIDLEIKKGESVALVGSSGAGKSTLANLVPRFIEASAGSVSIDGHPVEQLTLASLRAQIGMVTQETVLFDDSVRNNISCGREEVPLERVIASATAAHAHEFISALPEGYDTVLGELGSRLSLGQRQRIAVARALLKNPPILILDEATSALDAESEDLVQQALATLLEGRSALIIAHRLATVRQADRIVVLDQGRIAEEGSHETLLAAGGLYARLHELQFRDPGSGFDATEEMPSSPGTRTPE